VKEAAASADVDDAIFADEAAAQPKPKTPAVAAGEPRVRVMLSGVKQIYRDAFAVILTGVLLSAMALITLFVLVRDTFRRVEPALGQAKKMALGDFTQKLEADYQELETLYAGLNGISSSLSGMIVDVRGLGDEVNGAVDRIMGAAAELRTGADQGTRAVTVTEGAVATMAKGVDESASKLAELATTADASLRDTETIERTLGETGNSVLALRGEVERQKKSIKVISERARDLTQNARSLASAADVARASATRTQQSSAEASRRAEEAAKLADGALRDTQAGGKAIEDAVARIRDIARQAETMEGSLKGLTERVEGMKPVLGAIAEVTSRTSLLALNAGIIAAQAGERGAAFQVVVDELKSLASRTAALTATVEESVRLVLTQRGRTEEAAEQLRALLTSSIEDAQRAGEALDAIRGSTAQSQAVSAGIVETLSSQERDVADTLRRVDVVDQSSRSVETAGSAVSEEMRVLEEVAERVTRVTDDVVKASKQQGELAQRVGQVLTTVALQVRALSATHAGQHDDVSRVQTSIEEIRVFAHEARTGAALLEQAVVPVRQKASALSSALHRFRTRA
jgi:methyl-accepting chemotaxis protein